MKLKSWLILTFFIGLIFYLSSVPGLQVLPLLRQLSSLLSKFDLSLTHFSKWLADIIPLNFSELGPIKILGEDFLMYANDNPAYVEFLLRKIAHVVMFFFITTAFFLLASQYTKKPSTAIIIAFFGGTTMAFLDEYRQSFVPTRVASLMDVFINFIGVSLAIFIILFSLFITKSARIQQYYYKTFKEGNKESAKAEDTSKDDTASEDSSSTPQDNGDQATRIFDKEFVDKVNQDS